MKLKAQKCDSVLLLTDVLAKHTQLLKMSGCQWGGSEHWNVRNVIIYYLE